MKPVDLLYLTVLGVIQGATEFLPVSSSGHLALATLLFEPDTSPSLIREQPLMLEILLHLATLLAVVLFYRRDIVGAVKGFFRLFRFLDKEGLRQRIGTDDGARLAVAIIVGTVPTALLGVLLSDAAEMISKAPLYLGASFLCCAALLLSTRFLPERNRPLTLTAALLIGIVQGLAVFPGISRSGATIAIGLFCGLRKEEAVRFSFLLSLPAILGAALLELDPTELAGAGHLSAYLIGCAVAFVVGLLALFLLVHLVKRGRLWLFAPYVAAAGLFALLYLG
jgi:undecaprenyl-diphosphatase